MSTAAAAKQPKFNELKNTFRFFPFINQIQAYAVLIVLGVVFNITSLHNEYALDDGIIIHQNEFVLKGVKGIDSILTRDAYRSFYKRMKATDQLSGGRYRPLSVVSFAIEQEYIGPYQTGSYSAYEDANNNNVIDKNEYNRWVDVDQNKQLSANECLQCWDEYTEGQTTPINIPDPKTEDTNEDGVVNEVDCQLKNASLRHGVNIFTYILGVLLLYMFFSTCIFKDMQDVAFISALLFMMHPMHTEVIANVKSRDEIFSLIFISLTFFFAYRYVDYQNYFGKPSFATKGAPDLKKFLFVVVVAILVFFLYILRNSGASILACSVVIAGLIGYRSYNTFIKNKQYSRRELLVWTSLCFFLSLLSKEYAITLLVLVPIAFYVFLKTKFDLVSLLVPLVVFVLAAVAMLYMKMNRIGFVFMPFMFLLMLLAFQKEIKKQGYGAVLIVMYCSFMFYWAMRLTAVVIKPSVPDTELLNNPYLLATGEEKWASKVYVLLKYLRIMILPHPLSSDYSYNTIEYRHFGDFDFLFSLVLHIALAGLAVYLTIKRHIVGFALMVYFAFLMMIGNILMDIGATMGERLMFHSSIGFTIIVAWLLIKGLEKLSSINLGLRRGVLIILLAGVGFLYGCKYWERNWDWKNDITLFIKDANTVPNSVLVLGNAGARWVDLADTRFFNVPPGDSIIEPFSTYKDEMLNITISEQELKNGLMRDNIITSNEDSGTITLNDNGNQQGLSRRQLCLYKGIGYLKHATQLHPRYVNGYLNLGLAYYKLKRDREALFYWKHAERLYPNNPYLKSYYIAFYNDLLNRGYQKAARKQLDSAIYELNKCIILDRLNPEGWYNMGGAYYQKQNYAEAKRCWEECLKLNPNHAQAKTGLSTIIVATVPATPNKPR